MFSSDVAKHGVDVACNWSNFVTAQEAFSDLFQAAGSYEIGASKTFCFIFADIFYFLQLLITFYILQKDMDNH